MLAKAQRTAVCQFVQNQCSAPSVAIRPYSEDLWIWRPWPHPGRRRAKRLPNVAFVASSLHVASAERTKWGKWWPWTTILLDL